MVVRIVVSGIGTITLPQGATQEDIDRVKAQFTDKVIRVVRDSWRILPSAGLDPLHVPPRHPRIQRKRNQQECRHSKCRPRWAFPVDECANQQQ
jgi:hypothetical protein